MICPPGKSMIFYQSCPPPNIWLPAPPWIKLPFLPHNRLCLSQHAQFLLLNETESCLKSFEIDWFNNFQFNKNRSEEAINLRCLAYFTLAVVLMVTGMYYFINEVKNTFMSPAESRQLNKPCVILFFDNHSLWHFASAGGLLFTFMALLTLGKCCM